jgi:hypothetical protein
MLGNRVVLAGKAASQASDGLNSPQKTSGNAPSPNVKSHITKYSVVSYAGIAYAQEVLPEAYREMFERRMYLSLRV